MKLRVRGVIGAVVGGVLLAAAPAGATSVTWDGSNALTVYDAWTTDVTGTPSSLNFPTSAVCPGSSNAICVGGSATLGSFTFSGTALNVNYDTSNGNVKGFEAPVLTVTTPTGGINAFFIQIGDTTSGTPITVTLSDGQQITSVNSSPLDAPTFFAIAISHEITSFSISTASGSVFLDALYYGASSLTQDGGTGDGGNGGDTSQTSEAATILMMGGGLLALLGSRRKWIARFAA
ncbi:MAG TPA: hypothetical protein VG168_08315, partial [Bryobacteraceae bacterium]|jgi:hypothetical protein|nr:hypothetical protein [Bryobacteraceae bacterium]